jgi:hypothetical protein
MASVLRLVAMNTLEEINNIISWENTESLPKINAKLIHENVNQSMWQKLINYSKHNLIHRINFPWHQTQIAHGAQNQISKSNL